MKANEAPEKIYLEKVYPDNGVLPNGLNYNQSSNDIEYIRTDVFIDKAEEFIYSALNGGIMGTANIEDFMRLFRKYMEGEQGYGNDDYLYCINSFIVRNLVAYIMSSYGSIPSRHNRHLC